VKDREKENDMNYWLVDELTWQTCKERERELDPYRHQNDPGASQTQWTFITRFALQLSDWLIATGETLRRRYEKDASASAWSANRRFAR
jgi:hypothetical protein